MTSFLPPYSTRTWKILGYCLAGAILLGIVLFTMDRCGGYFDNRGNEKLRANVNVALQAVNAQREVIAGDKVAENRAIEDVKVAANAAIESSTATDEAKAQANTAVANWEAKKNANQPVGTTEAQLDEALRKLEQ